jgi:hypothetical protein
VLTRPDGLVIGQPAHAWVSGQLARAWGNADFPAPAPREPVCLAAEQHDVGWADADLAPSLGPDGRPRSFLEQPRPAHVAIWHGAARRMLAQSRYAALLVSLHGTSLYEHVDADAAPPAIASAIRAYREGERALQTGLGAGLDPEEVDRNRRLIVALDRLSLALCLGNATVLRDLPGTLRVEPAGAAAPAAAVAAARDDRAVPPATATERFVLDPWPFGAATLAVGCEARRLDGTFADERALHAALAAAPWVPLRWELSPA